MASEINEEIQDTVENVVHKKYSEHKNLQGDKKLAKMFADRISSQYNQHIICMIIGKTGMGKSYAGLDLAHETSVALSNKLGGTPEDYFDVNRNMALITMDSIINVLQNMKQYNVYVMDDIGTGWNARDFAKQKNKIMNNIVQTFRNWNSLLILTLPDTFLIDTVPRNLLHYQIEMTDQLFSKGLSIGKVSKVLKNHRMNKTYYKFIEGRNQKYVLWTFKKPPEHVITKYERLRNEIQKQEQEQYIKQLNDIKKAMEEKDPDNDKSNKKLSKKDRILMIKQDNEQLSPTQIASKVAKETGSCTVKHVQQVLKENNMDNISLQHNV